MAVIYLIAGFYFLVHPILGVAAFTLALAIFLVLEGVTDLIAYSRIAVRREWDGFSSTASSRQYSA